MDAATAGAAGAAPAQAAQQRQQQQQATAPPTNAALTAGNATAATAAPSTAPTTTGFLSKRSRPWPLFTPEQLADDTPSRRAGISAKRERSFYRSLYSLIKEGGMALKLEQRTTTTALLFGFRYFALRSFSKSDRYVVGAAALFLAAKARDELRALEAVAVACLKVRAAQGGGPGGGGKKKGGGGSAGAAQEGAGSVAASPLYTPTALPTPATGSSSSSALPSPASKASLGGAEKAAAGGGQEKTLAAQLADKAYMASFKEAVLTAERALLYALGFELDLELPHDALMGSIALLRKSELPAVADFWADPKHIQVTIFRFFLSFY